MHGLHRVAVFFAAVAALAWAMAAFSLAETSSTLPPSTPSHQTVPEAAPPAGSGSSGEGLSNKLDRSGGVIIPPAGIDPGLTQAPPPTGPGSMPVLPPAGTPGGKSDINPK